MTLLKRFAKVVSMTVVVSTLPLPAHAAGKSIGPGSGPSSGVSIGTGGDDSGAGSARLKQGQLRRQKPGDGSADVEGVKR